jgi:hypothetical protein
MKLKLFLHSEEKNVKDLLENNHKKNLAKAIEAPA